MAVALGHGGSGSRRCEGSEVVPLAPPETIHHRTAATKFHGKRDNLVEREFGRLKHEWALLPLRVRGLERVRLHADLTILAKLATVLSRTRAVPVT